MNSTQKPAGNWRITQVIGGEVGPGESEEDFISSIAFDSKGEHLCVGDSDGRIIVFERDNTSDSGASYSFQSEMTAHVTRFDVLRCTTIPPRIIDIKWLKPMGESHLFLTSTEGSINLCKARLRKKKIFTPLNQLSKGINDIQAPVHKLDEKPTWEHSVLREYPRLHHHDLNGLSVCANGINFISFDCSSIFMWHIEKELKTFPLIELKHGIADEDPEIFTSIEFSKTQESIFLFSTNKGPRLCDTRKSTANATKGQVKFEELAQLQKKNYFTDLLNFVSCATFCGENKIITREFFQTKVWDIRMTSRALSTTVLDTSLQTKLAEMVENELIYERFNVVCSPSKNYHATGFFNKTLHLVDNEGENEQISLDFNKKAKTKKIIKGSPEPLPESFNFRYKSPRIAWHPLEDIIAIPLESSIFIYSKI